VLSMVHFLPGETERALARSREAVDLAAKIKHPFSQAYALGVAAWLDAYRQDSAAMAAHATATIELSTAQALGFWLVWGSIFAGRALFDSGERAKGAKHMEDMLATYRGIGSGMVVPYFLTLLAEVEAANGDHESAHRRLNEARRVIAEGGEAFMAAEIERLDGEFRRARGAPEHDDAVIERLFLRARDIAHQQGNRVFALRAAASLASFLAARGDRAPARLGLAAALDAIPDRTDTPDLMRARTLLQSLGAHAPAVAD
jgi:predicted ATPase